MKSKPSHKNSMLNAAFALTGIAIAVAGLASCSNGGGSATPVAKLTGSVIDGRISGATVCLDLNANRACDSNEPTSVTDAVGNYNLNTEGLTAGMVNSAHLLVNVPGTAKDSDDAGLTITAAGKKPFSLLAPGNASGAVLVTPLTTLVSQELINDPSKTAAQAQTAVRDMLGLPESTDLYQDPSTGSTPIKNIAQAAVVSFGEIQNNLQMGASAGNITLSPEQLRAQTHGHFKQYFGNILANANLNSTTPVNLSQVRQNINNLTSSVANVTMAQTGVSTVGQPVNVSTALSETLYATSPSAVICAQTSSTAALPALARSASLLRPNAVQADTSSPVYSLPMGLTVQSGNVTFDYSGNNLTINQTSMQASITAPSLSVEGGNIIINQPSSLATMSIDVAQATVMNNGALTAGQGSLALNFASGVLFGSANTTFVIYANGTSIVINGTINNGTVGNTSQNTINLTGVLLGNTTINSTSPGPGVILAGNVSNGTSPVPGVIFGSGGILNGTINGNINGTINGTINGNTSGGVYLVGNVSTNASNPTGGVLLPGNISGSIVYAINPAGTGPSANTTVPTITAGSTGNPSGIGVTIVGTYAPNPATNISINASSTSPVWTCSVDISKKTLSASTAYSDVRYRKSGSSWADTGSPYVLSTANAGSSLELVNVLSQKDGWVLPSTNGTLTSSSGSFAGQLTYASGGLISKLTAKAVDISGWLPKQIRGIESLNMSQNAFPTGSKLYWMTEERSTDVYYIYPIFETTQQGASYSSLTELVADRATSLGAEKAVGLPFHGGMWVTFGSNYEVSFWSRGTNASTQAGTIIGTGRYELRAINGQNLLVITQIPAAAYANLSMVMNAVQRRQLPIFGVKNGKVYAGNLSPKGSFDDFSTPHFNPTAMRKLASQLNWPDLP